MGVREDGSWMRVRGAEAMPAAAADYYIKLKIFTETHTSIYAFTIVPEYEKD